MNFRLYYPGFRKKALTFSYDDGQTFDRRLAELFRNYHLKATFHLNSGTLDTAGYVTKAELPLLYEGQEIACHGVNHAFPAQLAREHLLQEYYQDRKTLEECTGRIIRGCSYAYGEYNENVIAMLRSLGFAYSRTVEATGNFGVPQDFLRWTPTCHHNDALDKDVVKRFLNLPEYHHIPLLYIWGHSYEFERDRTWEKMEELCASLAGKDDVWYTTNIDYVNYMNAARSLLFSVDGRRVENLSAIDVYAQMNGERVILRPSGQ